MDNEDYVVYVLDKDKKPLMPTKRFGKVRRLLKSGKAKVIDLKPFTIQLLYEPETNTVQDITVGIDPGRTNIGLSAVDGNGRCLYAAKVITRNKKIPNLMSKRRDHRQTSRRGERLARKRLAAKHHTLSKKDLSRVLPGCEEPMRPKGIINTESRFANRKREAGWLTPTATQLLRTHLNAVKKVCAILPVKRVVLEVNRFAFMALDDPGIRKWEYSKGPLHGTGGLKNAVTEQQAGKCLLCRKRPIEHFHHIVPVHRNGSNTIENIAGLCVKCHESVHKSDSAKEKLETRKSGINKKYGALSILNQIIPYLTEGLKEMFPGGAYVTEGYSTKLFRDRFSIEKDHDTDAYAIACSINRSLSKVSLPHSSYKIMQYRRHSRARIHSQRERIYKLDGVKVATNRRKRMDQKTDSLEEWYAKAKTAHGKEEAQKMLSRLTVTRSTRRYNNMKRILPGAVFIYKGVRYVMAGQITNGRYFIPEGYKINAPRSECKVVAYNGGLVYV